MKVLYLDCFAGISGDMTLGALLDAGADVRNLNEGISRLGLGDFRLEFWEANSHGMRGTRVEIGVKEEQQPHRHLNDILNIIESSGLPEPIITKSSAIFIQLAKAEGRVHGKPPEHVHFHEVGAVDSIIDIVGSVIAMHSLGIDKIVCSPLPLGSGYVSCQHGLLPVPAPATVELVKDLPIRKLDMEGELVTPTGAAIVKTLSSSFGPIPGMKIITTGYGLGSRDYGMPNFLRIIIGNDLEDKTIAPDSADAGEIVVMETNIDDMSPEVLAYVSDILLNSGALDVFIVPIIMKKSRPGHLLTILCYPSDQKILAEIIFKETTTFGIRFSQQQRAVLKRKMVSVSTKYGDINVKLGFLKDKKLASCSPEFEDCKKCAALTGVPLKEVYNAAMQAVRGICRERS